jgi:hypothetical protein
LASPKGFKAIGREGRVLDEEWQDEPRLYLGHVYVRSIKTNLSVVVDNNNIKTHFYSFYSLCIYILNIALKSNGDACSIKGFFQHNKIQS